MLSQTEIQKMNDNTENIIKSKVSMQKLLFPSDGLKWPHTPADSFSYTEATEVGQT